MAARVLFSPSFRYYYCVMIAINLFALAFSFYEYQLAPHLLWFIALEFFLTVSLVLVRTRNVAVPMSPEISTTHNASLILVHELTGTDVADDSGRHMQCQLFSIPVELV